MSTVFTQKISLMALVWVGEDLKVERPALLVRKEFMLVLRQEEGQENVGTVAWVCLLPLTEAMIITPSLCIPMFSIPHARS